MRRPRLKFGVRHAMLAVAAVALVLGVARVAVRAIPHARECWGLARLDDGYARGFRRTAAGYRGCPCVVPRVLGAYCNNACLPHAPAEPPDPEARRSAAEAHRAVAEEFERVARGHEALARALRRAMFRYWEPVPDRWPTESAGLEVTRRFQCDVF